MASHEEDEDTHSDIYSTVVIHRTREDDDDDGVDGDGDAYGDADDGFTSDWDEIEDFSPEWWNLVHISPYFCEYWLQNYEASGAEEDLVILSLQDEESSIDAVDVYVDDDVDDIVVKS